MHTFLFSKHRALLPFCLLLLILLSLSFLHHQKHYTPYASGQMLSLKVISNHLVNQNGQQIRLIGMNIIAGLPCVAPTNQGIFEVPSMTQAIPEMVKWHINAVRLTLNEDCWLGINGVTPQYSGSNYQQAIISTIQQFHSYGIYVIVDLHINAPGTHLAQAQQPMADADHADSYWTSIANTFKNDPAVIFEPYNEPNLTSFNTLSTNYWACWRDGNCTITRYNPCPPSNNCQPTPLQWQPEGMQGMVNAIRATGATNPIMLGGLYAANDLSELLQYLPSDPQHQLIASFHNYGSANGGGPAGACDTISCWNTIIAPIALQMPVITGEFGEHDCQTTFVAEYMQWADQHNISYFTLQWWPYTPCSAMGLLTNWGGTPSTYGQTIYTHFQAVNPIISGGPTPTNPIPSVTVTPTPGKIQVLFTIFLHGIGLGGDNANPHSVGNPNPLHLTRNMVISLFNTQNKLMGQPTDGTISYASASGNFQATVPLVNVQAGQYEILVHVDGFLNAYVPGIQTISLAGQSYTLPPVYLVTGDINNDNTLNLLDYNALIDCYGIKVSSPYCMYPPNEKSAGADILDGGQVSGADYNELLRELSVENGQ